LHRNLEECLQEKKGRKTLYGQCYSSREEFWQIYDRIEYERLRKQYHAEDKFVDIYDKVSEAYSEIITLYLGQ
jgi:delta24-sterol reductase